MAKMGRPSKYKTSHCAALIKHMKQGYSFESFGGLDSVDASKQTLYAWVKKHGDFLDAKNKGTSKSLYFWEQMGRAGAAGKIEKFNPASWIFNMKNRFAWRDKQEITSPDGSMQPQVILMMPDNGKGKKR